MGWAEGRHRLGDLDGLCLHCLDQGRVCLFNDALMKKVANLPERLVNEFLFALSPMPCRKGGPHNTLSSPCEPFLARQQIIPVSPPSLSWAMHEYGS